MADDGILVGGGGYVGLSVAVLVSTYLIIAAASSVLPGG